MNSLSIAIVAAILLFIVGLFIRITMILRRRGGSMVTTMLGATYELHGQDRRKAIETIVEKAADQKTEEQASGDPKEKPGSFQFEK